MWQIAASRVLSAKTRMFQNSSIKAHMSAKNMPLRLYANKLYSAVIINVQYRKKRESAAEITQLLHTAGKKTFYTSSLL